ncbi:hypothetical protein D9M71_808160 [compost metagenome]
MASSVMLRTLQSGSLRLARMRSSFCWRMYSLGVVRALRSNKAYSERRLMLACCASCSLQMSCLRLALMYSAIRSKDAAWLLRASRLTLVCIRVSSLLATIWL